MWNVIKNETKNVNKNSFFCSIFVIYLIFWPLTLRNSMVTSLFLNLIFTYFSIIRKIFYNKKLQDLKKFHLFVWGLGYLSLFLGVTNNPSPCAFYFLKGFGYLSLCLGIMILHLTPVTSPCMVKMLLHWWWFTPTAWHTHNWMNIFP